MKIEEYKDQKEEHRIRLTADNGNIIYASTEGYKNIEDARQAALSSSIEVLKRYYRHLSWDQILDLQEFAGSLTITGSNANKEN